jgi:hypothetical protein
MSRVVPVFSRDRVSFLSWDINPACQHWKIEPDPELLQYNKTYESTRPDLKEIAG